MLMSYLLLALLPTVSVGQDLSPGQEVGGKQAKGQTKNPLANKQGNGKNSTEPIKKKGSNSTSNASK